MSFSLRNPYSIYYLTAMKTNFFLLCLLLAISANAQIVYHDASAFPLLGKATETTLTRYERLPDSLRNISRKPLWELGRNSAGLARTFPFQFHPDCRQMGGTAQQEYEPHDPYGH